MARCDALCKIAHDFECKWNESTNEKKHKQHPGRQRKTYRARVNCYEFKTTIRYDTIRRKDAFKNNNILLFKGENKTEQPLNNCKTKTASVAITTTPPTLILTLHTCRKAFFFCYIFLSFLKINTCQRYNSDIWQLCQIIFNWAGFESIRILSFERVAFRNSSGPKYIKTRFNYKKHFSLATATKKTQQKPNTIPLTFQFNAQ